MNLSMVLAQVGAMLGDDETWLQGFKLGERAVLHLFPSVLFCPQYTRIGISGRLISGSDVAVHASLEPATKPIRWR